MMPEKIWLKSSFSNSSCVEVCIRSNAVLLRDSKNPSGQVISFSHPEWFAFLKGARSGEFEIPEPQ
jgi:hypothetical protein